MNALKKKTCALDLAQPPASLLGCIYLQFYYCFYYLSSCFRTHSFLEYIFLILVFCWINYRKSSCWSNQQHSHCCVTDQGTKGFRTLRWTHETFLQVSRFSCKEHFPTFLRSAMNQILVFPTLT